MRRWVTIGYLLPAVAGRHLFVVGCLGCEARIAEPGADGENAPAIDILCGACARIRDAVIGFPAHGAWQKVETAIAARDVPPGEPWVFRDHRTMAEVIADEATAA